MLAVFVAVAAAAGDDGSYRPEHHGGAYTHQGVAYKHDSGKYVHQAEPVVVPQRFVQPAPVVVAPQQFVAPQVVARQYNNEGHWQILRDSRQQSPTGDYAFEYETENGIHQSEQNNAVPPQSQRSTGFYEYKSPEGQTIRVDYTADENGFQPQGAHLPVGPEIPLAIQRSVEYQLKFARSQ